MRAVPEGVTRAFLGPFGQGSAFSGSQIPLTNRLQIVYSIFIGLEFS
jgi:hypothetical protein